MIDIPFADIMDDLRAADKALRRFEQRYELGSDAFYSLYSQGLLDDGEHLEDFAEWSGYYQTKQHREQLLKEFSQERVERLLQDTRDTFVQLDPQEPVQPQDELIKALHAELITLAEASAKAAQEINMAKAEEEKARADAMMALAKAEKARADALAMRIEAGLLDKDRPNPDQFSDIATVYRQIERELAVLRDAVVPLSQE